MANILGVLSSGGTMASALINMLIEEAPELPKPVGLVLIYPCMQVGLDFWISNEDLAVIEEEISRGPIPEDILKARPGRGDGMTLNSKAAFMDDAILSTTFVSRISVKVLFSSVIIQQRSELISFLLCFLL